MLDTAWSMTDRRLPRGTRHGTTPSLVRVSVCPSSHTGLSDCSDGGQTLGQTPGHQTDRQKIGVCRCAARKNCLNAPQLRLRRSQLSSRTAVFIPCSALRSPSGWRLSNASFSSLLHCCMLCRRLIMKSFFCFLVFPCTAACCRSCCRLHCPFRLLTSRYCVVAAAAAAASTR